jgi:hypothetical protein
MTKMEPKIESKEYKIPSGKTIVFNDQQWEAIQKIKQWLKGSEVAYTLSGYAGTGKSSITGYIIQGHKSVVVSAPTHKAKIVIERYTGQEAATIQSLLGLQPNTSLEEFDINNVQFDPIGKKRISEFRLVVVDEASMLNKDLYTMLKDEAKRYNTKLLFMGDNAQLPPINEYKSKVFTESNISQLTKVERQSHDNPLMFLYDNIRSNIESGKDMFDHIDNTIEEHDGRKGVLFLNEEIFSNAIIEVFSSEHYAEDANYCKVLAYTNDRVKKWNKVVRDAIIGTDKRVVEPGDVLMCYNTLSKNGKGMLFNSADYKVLKIQEKSDSKEIKTYYTTLQDIDTKTKVEVSILVPEYTNTEKFRTLIQEIRMKAKGATGKLRRGMWAQYYEMKSQYLLMEPVGDIAKDLDYGYACTVHKSQGSTYNNIFVDEDDIEGNKKNTERNKLKYVAFSRPTHMVYSLYTGVKVVRKNIEDYKLELQQHKGLLKECLMYIKATDGEETELYKAVETLIRE